MRRRLPRPDSTVPRSSNHSRLAPSQDAALPRTEPADGACARRLDLQIAWPGGATQSFPDVPLDHIDTLREGEDLVPVEARPFTLGSTTR